MAKGKNNAGASNANTDRKAAIAKAAASIKPAAVTALATAAISAVTSRLQLGASLVAFIGNAKPDTPLYSARYAEGKRALLLGYLAGNFRRNGDNRNDDELLAYAATVLDCAKPDAEKIDDKAGQRRCTDAEWKARRAGAVWLSGIVKECGITPPTSLGGGVTEEAKKAKKAKALKEAKANPKAVIANIRSETAQAAIKQAIANARKADKEALALAPPAANDAEAFVEYAERMMVMLLQRLDKVAAATGNAIPPQVGSALTDCKAAIAKARKTK